MCFSAVRVEQNTEVVVHLTMQNVSLHIYSWQDEREPFSHKISAVSQLTRSLVLRKHFKIALYGNTNMGGNLHISRVVSQSICSRSPCFVIHNHFLQASVAYS